MRKWRSLNLGVYAIYGLLAPRGRLLPSRKTLSDAFNKVAEMPDVVSRLEPMSVKPATSNPNELRQYLESEGKRWRELGKDAEHHGELTSGQVFDSCPRHRQFDVDRLPMPTDSNLWDDIVIGAGSAGCVVAARLSENTSRRVLAT